MQWVADHRRLHYRAKIVSLQHEEQQLVNVPVEALVPWG